MTTEAMIDKLIQLSNTIEKARMEQEDGMVSMLCFSCFHAFKVPETELVETDRGLRVLSPSSTYHCTNPFCLYNPGSVITISSG